MTLLVTHAMIDKTVQGVKHHEIKLHENNYEEEKY